jgi:hypothetical protein
VSRDDLADTDSPLVPIYGCAAFFILIVVIVLVASGLIVWMTLK